MKTLRYVTREAHSAQFLVAVLLAAVLGACASTRTPTLAADVSKAGIAAADSGRDVIKDISALPAIERQIDRRLLAITLPDAARMSTPLLAAAGSSNADNALTKSLNQLDEAFKAMRLAYQRFGLLADQGIVTSAEQGAANLIAAAEQIDKLPQELMKGLPPLVGLIMADLQEKKLKEHNIVLAEIDKRLGEVLEQAIPILKKMAKDVYERAANQLTGMDIERLDATRVKALVKDPYSPVVLKRLYIIEQLQAVDTQLGGLGAKIQNTSTAFSALAKAHQALAEDEPNFVDVLTQIERIRSLLSK